MTTTKTTTTTSKDTRSFLTRHSTLWVTLVRLGLILLPTLVSSASWLYNPSFVSVLIRPHESLAQLEEARAIRALTSRTDFSGFYDANDSVRIPPLLLAVLTKILETTGSNVGFWLSLFLLVVDLLIAYRIEQIGTRLLDLAFSARPSDDGNSFTEEELQRRLPECVRPQFAHIFPIYGEGSSKEENDTKQQFYEPSISIKSLPLLSAQIYYWSPFTILPSSLLYCWQNIASLFLVSSLYESTHCSSKGSLSMASFFLAVATYLEPHHLAYVTPIILLSSVSSDSNRFVSFSVTGPWKWEKPAIFVIVTFALWLLLLQGVSCILVGPENYGRILGAVYGTTWLTTSPNLSLQWYFRMQIFSRFRDYFGAMYAGVPFMLIGPLCLRFFRYPGVLIASYAMIGALYRPVQVLYDANFAFCFFLFCPRSLARMGYAGFIALTCVLVPVILNIVDHWMWLDANNGNANYMFFQCLAYNIFLGIVLGQFVSASMQRDKALRMTIEKIDATK